MISLNVKMLKCYHNNNNNNNNISNNIDRKRTGFHSDFAMDSTIWRPELEVKLDTITFNSLYTI